MGFKLTWIGILISDSGKESILKSVFVSEGLSGIIFFEQEIKLIAEIINPKQNLERLDIVFQSKRFSHKKRVNKD